MVFSTLTQENPIRDFVNENPLRTIPVLKNLGIDFCCGGGKSLQRACEENQLNPEEVLQELKNAAVQDSKPDQQDWNSMNPPDLIHHIVETHHSYLNKALPEITETLEKVLQAHGENHPELSQLQETFLTLRQDLEPHMWKEENILFPRISSLHEENQLISGMPSNSVENPIRVMLSDHDHVGALLATIRKLTHDYRPPQDACQTFKYLYIKLNELEDDTHLHIHKENNLLFQKALGHF
jgi:regulator of cell morphogenesis and NO signaling